MQTRAIRACVNGKIVETVITIEKESIEAEKAEAEYWSNIDYGEAVHAKIRERYSDSQEFAILRQKDDKPEEYAEYFAYCEECKAYVKEMKTKYE